MGERRCNAATRAVPEDKDLLFALQLTYSLDDAGKHCLAVFERGALGTSVPKPVGIVASVGRVWEIMCGRFYSYVKFRVSGGTDR